uniref:Secreted protein n=1 Tax=Heterorhabditis bacteriophora TaxID=37862 RepID=A0A1I7XGR4_HETBA
MWLLQLFLIPQVTAWFYGRDAPDRWSVWPLPQIIIYGKMNRTIHPEKIGFDLAEKKDCEVLRTNVKNYMNKWMFPFPVATKKFGREFIVSIRVKENCLYFPPQHGFRSLFSSTYLLTKLVFPEEFLHLGGDEVEVFILECWYLNYIKYGADWRDEIAGFVPSTSR